MIKLTSRQQGNTTTLEIRSAQPWLRIYNCIWKKYNKYHEDKISIGSPIHSSKLKRNLQRASIYHAY